MSVRARAGSARALRGSLVLSIVLGVGAGAARAQDGSESDAIEAAESGTVEDRLKALERRIKELESGRGAGGEASAAAGSSEGKDLDFKVKSLLPPEISALDGKIRIKLNTRLHVDFRSDLTSNFIDNSFQVRRARATLSGKLYKRLDFKFGFEFGRTTDADIRDAFVSLRIIDALQLTAGQQLVPFSIERLTTSNHMVHPERPIAVDQLAGPRDVGATLFGHLGEDRLLSWYASVLNGNGENRRLDNDQDMDWVGRIVLRPFAGLTLDGAYRISPTNLAARAPDDPATVGGAGATFLVWNPAVRVRGDRHRVSTGARWRWGPLELKGEFLLDRLERVTLGAAESEITAWSAFGDLSWVITGEDRDGAIAPSSPALDLESGEFLKGPGAVVLSLRYEYYRVGAEVRRRAFAVGTDQVHSATATVTWWLARPLRLMVSGTGARFGNRVADRSGDRRRTDLIAVLRLSFHF